MLDILYKDLEIIAINKPHGLLVHRSSIAADTSEFALQLLRDQIGQAVYPAHRLDRKTAGALLFSLTKEMDSQLQNLFATRQTNKTYWAIVRGYTEDTFSVDYPLKKKMERYKMHSHISGRCIAPSCRYHKENIPLLAIRWLKRYR